MPLAASAHASLPPILHAVDGQPLATDIGSSMGLPERIW
jgi:hypothetical protein